MTETTIPVGMMSLFRTRTIRLISLNLFFQWFVCYIIVNPIKYFFLLLGLHKILFIMALHRIQVCLSFHIFFSQSYFFNCLGAWKFDPYLSFALSALVELLGYIFVHTILNRFGRKKLYCLFAIVFGLLALFIIPIQNVLFKNQDS